MVEASTDVDKFNADRYCESTTKMAENTDAIDI